MNNVGLETAGARRATKGGRLGAVHKAASAWTGQLVDLTGRIVSCTTGICRLALCLSMRPGTSSAGSRTPRCRRRTPRPRSRPASRSTSTSPAWRPSSRSASTAWSPSTGTAATARCWSTTSCAGGRRAHAGHEARGRLPGAARGDGLRHPGDRGDLPRQRACRSTSSSWPGARQERAADADLRRRDPRSRSR